MGESMRVLGGEGVVGYAAFIMTNRSTGRVRRYEVSEPGNPLSERKARRAAYNAADKGDLAYGSICCSVQSVMVGEERVA